jgi:hypothetical protein
MIAFLSPPELEQPIRAAREVAMAHGVEPDRCDVLQNGNTLVLRLTDSLVARVITDRDGPRQGGAWFEREIAVAKYLAERGAPVIPLHPRLPPGPHEQLGFTLNFWQFVTAVDQEAAPAETGRTLHQCHALLRDYAGWLPQLAIPVESLALLETLERRALFPQETLSLLRQRLESSLEAISQCPLQPLHGDAHPGNVMNTADGPLWTDWEDTFLGPVEWDLASLIWNPLLLENNRPAAADVLTAYQEAGGVIKREALEQSLIARAAVMSAWYPILYPNSSPERQAKLQHRLEWLRNPVF